MFKVSGFPICERVHHEDSHGPAQQQNESTYLREVPREMQFNKHEKPIGWAWRVQVGKKRPAFPCHDAMYECGWWDPSKRKRK